MLDIALQVLERLSAQGRKLATAESCTGGLIAAALTDVPGSSKVFERGFVTYSNDSKIEMLGVPVGCIDQYGAVSIETAAAMAQGALKTSKADLAISVTGIAGPDGGTVDKPVGMVCFGLAVREGDADLTLKTHQEIFEGNSRAAIREKALHHALKMIIEA